ncbi:MAG: class I SAM-dependent methyltransferase, partial [Verrucomicrobiota bacterium]|nr:class I SAM-dependent methyltransferase [Verrucomicrobiota bacterium]
METQGPQWRERQQEMEGWYQQLIAKPASAAECLISDYSPFAPLLEQVSGRVLDVGGGIGVVRQFLPGIADYIVLDPSLDWLGAEWTTLSERFPCLARKPKFVRGVGESMPFPDRSFDAVLSFWSLNHASDPDKVIQETHRVLRPGGYFLLVLEDMEPRWRDLLTRAFVREGIMHASRMAALKLRNVFRGRSWPLQADHIRIAESGIQSCNSDRFAVIRRAWIAQYL